jgi:peptidoglycan/xylan/chitin deacetylase (PgdA/CDA1 family)
MRQRRLWTVACASLAACVLVLPAAQAAPGDPRPQPPRSRVLAVDPRTVEPPDDVAATRSVTCPPAGDGVRTSAPGSGKTVALTFDDGPGPETGGVVRVLEDAGVAGTFFNIGVNMTVRPSEVTAEDAQQFLLGNHTWDHPEMPSLSSTGQAVEMDRHAAEQRSLVGYSACVFRPPYGAYDGTTLDLAQARRMSVWNWSVDTLDWQARGSSSSFWVDRIVRLAQAGGSQAHPVVLMHTQPGGSAATLAALPRIISYYRDRGYAFVDLLGRQGYEPIAGDWDGDGDDTPGVFQAGKWYLRNSSTTGPADVVLGFGYPYDQPVVGDWNGDGIDTPGVFHLGKWYLRNTNDPRDPGRISLGFGLSSYTPVAGDWNGDRRDTPGIVTPGGTWVLRTTNEAVSGNIRFVYGAGYRPVVGDWNGDRIDTPGIVGGNTWVLRTTNAEVSSRTTFTYGLSTDRLVPGDWDRDGDTTPGVVRGKSWYLRNLNSSGGGQVAFTFGP